MKKTFQSLDKEGRIYPGAMAKKRIKELQDFQEKIIESYENLNNSYEKLLTSISGGGVILLSILSFMGGIDLFYTFTISLFLFALSIILILLGQFCGLKARSKNIGKITAEEYEDTETAKKLKKSKEKWNCCADFVHNISLLSCIIGIVAMLFFIYFNLLFF